jgi:hypothetical protein
VKKFVLLYMADVSAEQQMGASPEEAKKGMELWMAWFQRAGSAVVDGGAPLGMAENVTQAGSGPRKTQIGGYTIVQAEDIAAAKELLANHPHLMMPAGNPSIEVLEVLPMPGM